MSIDDYAKLVQSLQQTLHQFQKTVAALRADLAKRDGENAELRRMLFGKRRERMPPIEREIAKKSADPEARKEKAPSDGRPQFKKARVTRGRDHSPGGT